MLIKQKMENVDLHERRDNKHPLHVVTCFQFLRKKEKKKKTFTVLYKLFSLSHFFPHHSDTWSLKYVKASIPGL